MRAPDPSGTSVPVEDELFTELTTRRLGPVRRYFLRHPVVMDLLIMAIFLLSSVTTVVLPTDPEFMAPRRGPLWLALGVVGLATAVLFWRRRRPVLTAVGVAVLIVLSLATTGQTLGTELLSAFVIYAVAASQRTRTAWLTAGGLLLTLAGAVWLWDSSVGRSGVAVLEAGPGEGWLLFVAAVTSQAVVSLAALAIGVGVRNRRLHVADLIERGNALARDRDRETRLARAEERSRIAREMHDVVAHSLSVMIALGDGAGAALDRAPDRARAALDELSATGRSALADMRRVLGVLHEEAPLDPQPTSQDLAGLVERFRTAGLAVRTEGLDTPLPQDTGLQLAVYRIVQESLTNALRHAPATAEVHVRVRTVPGRVEVEVVDRGAGVPVEDAGGTGRGLIGMSERAAVYGGTVAAGPWHGGWRVHAVLPWATMERMGKR